MKNFGYRRVDSLADARRLAAERGIQLVSGGQSLIRDMKLGLVNPDGLVDLNGLTGRDISIQGNRITIQAGCTHAEVASSALLGERYPTIAELVGHIGDPAVRHRGTLGGAIAAYEVNGDYPAACLALNATIRTSDRDWSASNFFNCAALHTMLAPGEIVLDISFDIPEKSAYVKILNPAARYAMVGVFFAKDQAGKVRIALTGASRHGAFRWRGAETIAHGQLCPMKLEEATFSGVDFTSDLFADAEYREHLARVLTQRAMTLADGNEPHVHVISHGARQMGMRYEVP